MYTREGNDYTVVIEKQYEEFLLSMKQGHSFLPILGGVANIAFSGERTLNYAVQIIDVIKSTDTIQ
ncbi:hypothetical protein ACTHRH_23950 [Paenibacillus sp. SAFN-117]